MPWTYRVYGTIPASRDTSTSWPSWPMRPCRCPTSPRGGRGRVAVFPFKQRNVDPKPEDMEGKGRDDTHLKATVVTIQSCEIFIAVLCIRNYSRLTQHAVVKRWCRRQWRGGRCNGSSFRTRFHPRPAPVPVWP